MGGELQGVYPSLFARRPDGSFSVKLDTSCPDEEAPCLAPEYWAEGPEAADEASDVFSFASLAYLMISGRYPYRRSPGQNPEAMAKQWLALSPMLSFNAQPFKLFPDLRAVMSKALDVDRRKRYATLVDFMAALQALGSKEVSLGEGRVYLCEEVIGRGGYGEVYRVQRKSDGEIFAMKKLLAGGSIERFLLEAEMLHDHPHPRLVGYEDSGQDEVGDYYLVLEYLHDIDIGLITNRIKTFPNGLPAQEVVPMFIEFCRALRHLHDRDNPILHRDIKPGNLYSPPGRPEHARVFDLGVAKDVNGMETMGQMPGTMQYMAPELAFKNNGRGSIASDIYALGCVFYECLNGVPPGGRLPTESNEAYTAFLARCRNPLEVVFRHAVFTQFPGLAVVAGKALAVDPAERFASMAEMQMALARVWAVTESLEQVLERAAQGEEVFGSLDELPSEGLSEPIVEETVKEGASKQNKKVLWVVLLMVIEGILIWWLSSR